MKNPFEYLKIDGRGQLPEPWSDYPVLTEYETVPVYRDGRDYVDVFVGQQDGWWVCGVHMNAHGSGSGFYPGRKWGSSPPVTTLFCGDWAGSSLGWRSLMARYSGRSGKGLTISGNSKFSDHEACIECEGYPQQEV